MHLEDRFTGYNGPTGSAPRARQGILNALPAHGLASLCPEHCEAVLDSADALDSLLCAFAAVAVSETRIGSEPTVIARHEGLIAVHI